ncbi:MAG: hypothetical protein KDA48_17240, partial [Amphiplicatus sp.]|nr:hypothetical protein [Amphiplicatus sp.]
MRKNSKKYGLFSMRGKGDRNGSLKQVGASGAEPLQSEFISYRALEQRIAFDAAAAVLFQEATDAPSQDVKQVEADKSNDLSTLADAAQTFFGRSISSGQDAAGQGSIVFVDSQIDDLEA